MPRSPPHADIVDFCGFKLRLEVKRKQKEGGTKYKNVYRKGDKQYAAYATRKGIKVFIGTYKGEYDAAVAIIAW